MSRMKPLNWRATTSLDDTLVRDGIVVHEGHLASLQRFKDSVKEVAAEAKEDAPAVA